MGAPGSAAVSQNSCGSAGLAAWQGWGLCTGSGWPLAPQPASPPSHGHPRGCGSPRSVGLRQRCCPRCEVGSLVAAGTFCDKALRVTCPARGDGQAPALRTPTGSSPSALSAGDPAAAPGPVSAANWQRCCLHPPRRRGTAWFGGGTWLVVFHAMPSASC